MTAVEAQHHRRTMRGIALIMSAVFMFSEMDTRAKHMLKFAEEKRCPNSKPN